MLLLFLLTVISVSGKTITGIVISEDKSPVEAASVAVFSADGKNYIMGCLTNEKGEFVCATDSLPVMLNVTCLGFEKKSVMVNDEKPLEITLKKVSYELDEVTAIAHNVKYNPSGYLVDLSNSDLVQGKKIPEMLGYLPGLSYLDGSLTVLAQAPSMVFVNDIEVNGIAEIKNIPAERIKSVEISYTTGSKYLNGSGGGAIIRIKLKKRSSAGYDGSLSVNTQEGTQYGHTGDGADGYIETGNGQLSLINWGNYYRYCGKYFEDKLYHDFSDDNVTTSRDVTKSQRPTVLDRLSLTYDLSDYHTLAASSYYSYGYERNRLTSGSDGDEKSTLLTDRSKTHQFQQVVKYTWLQKNKHDRLEITADYMMTRSDYSQIFSKPDIDDENTSISDSHNDMFSVRLDGKTQIGSVDLNWGGSCQFVYNHDDTHFTENVITKMNANTPYFYASVQGRAGKVMYDAGLQYQWVNTSVTVNGTKDTRHKQGLCPSLSLNYIINQDAGHTLSFNCRRGYSTLPYSVISSYPRYKDQYSFSIGNPDLRTPVNYNATIALNLFNSLTASAIMRHTTDPIYFTTELTQIDNVTQYYEIPKNGKYENQFIYTLSYLYRPSRKWNIKPTILFATNSINTPDYKYRSQPMWRYSINGGFEFTKTSGVTLTLSYEPSYRNQNVTFCEVPGFYMNLYKIFKHKTNQFEIDFESTLWKKGRKLITDGKNFKTITRHQSDQPYARISFVWWFSGGKQVNIKDEAKQIQQYQKYETDKK